MDKMKDVIMEFLSPEANLFVYSLSFGLLLSLAPGLIIFAMMFKCGTFLDINVVIDLFRSLHLSGDIQAIVEDIFMDHIEEVVGCGMKGTKGQDVYLCGSARLLAQNGIDTQNLPFANVYLAKNQQVLAYCVLADAVKPDAPQTVQRLGQLGVQKMVMLTGDNEQSARLAAQACALSDYRAQLLPENKLSLFQELSNTYSPTAFIGDGINDSPVIAAADVGISMGLGSGAAIEASDAVLVSGNLAPLCDAIKISRRTVGVAKFNIAFSLIVKIAVLVLGVLGLASMGLAIFADVGVTIICVIIAMSVFGYRARQ